MAALALPNSPGTVRSLSMEAAESSSADSSFDPAPPNMPASASHSDKFVAPGQVAPSLSAKDKVLMGLKDSISPFSAASWVVVSEYSHVTDSSPNFGVDKGAYGQRLGAAAIRGISEDLFTTSLMANVFHEDPRYYKLGRSHRIGRRIVYAATRVIITRTDSGRPTANLALFSGNLEASILTNAYYPARNHGFGQTMEIFAGSIGGSALGFGVSEFLSDALSFVHLKEDD